MGKKKGCCCACCTPMVTIVFLVILGVVIACLGAASIPLFKDLYEKQVKTNLIMKKGNEAYNNWHSPPAPVYMEYYIYNYTNHDDVVNKNAKPNVTQHGPYKYREIRTNLIIASNEYNITYLQNYSYVFDPELSCVNCSEDDVMFVPNTPILAIAKMLHDAVKDFNIVEKIAFKLVNKFLENKEEWNLYKRLTVHELLWGYNEPFLEEIDKIEKLIKYFIGKHIDLPNIDPFVALQHNGTEEALSVGNLTIVTGKRDINHVQNIVAWRGKTVAPYWLTPYGKMINGSDGSHARPFVTKDDTIYVFTAELCRSLYFKYLEDRTFRDISLYRFHTTAELFANSTVNPDNGAFCNAEKCWGSGLLPVGQCQDGNPPVFMSAPHFYQGDPSLVDAINGLHPVESLHATYLDVEPITGITMEAHKRLQINVLVQKDSSLTLLTHLHNDDNFLPVLWVHEEAIIDKKSADKFKNEVLKPKKILSGVSYGLMALGAFIVLIACIAGVVVKSRQNTYTEFVDAEDDSKDDGSVNPEII